MTQKQREAIIRLFGELEGLSWIVVNQISVSVSDALESMRDQLEELLQEADDGK